MIERKIEQVDEHDRRLLLTASVQGHQFDSMIVAEAADMDPGEVEDRLEKLERVHVFVKRGDEQEFPDRTLTLHYQFVHVLYQNMLYASLQPTRRKASADASPKRCCVTTEISSSTIAGQLAVLFEGARDFAASAQYFVTAARHCGRPVCVPRGRIAVRSRSRRIARAARRAGAQSSRSSGCR